MTAKIIDGNAIARQFRREIAIQVQALVAAGITPGLAVILVGDNPASQVYVTRKVKACMEVGIASQRHEFPADIEPSEVLELIEKLNGDPMVHGILVQLPLPAHFDIRTAAILNLEQPGKISLFFQYPFLEHGIPFCSDRKIHPSGPDRPDQTNV